MERGSEDIDRRTELAMRYVAEREPLERPTLRELHQGVADILDQAAVRGRASVDSTRRLSAMSSEWASAGGSATGAALLLTAQGTIGMLNVSGDNGPLRDHTFGELRQLKLAWRSVAPTISTEPTMIPAEGLEAALVLVDRFEAAARGREEEAAHVLQRILVECGFWVNAQRSPLIDRKGVDMSFTGRLEDRDENVGVILKGGRGPVSGQTVYRALDLSRAEFDRVLLVSTGGFSNLALDRSNTDRLGRVDLLTPEDLRNWLRRHTTPPDESRPCIEIIRAGMQELARRLGERPEELADISWLDLERVLREVFEGLGFATELTRPAGDGGFDLRLTDERGQVVLVEVKHWMAPSRPGRSALRRLIQVTANEGASSGLLLSSSGFTKTIYEGLLEVGPPVRLGDGSKITSLCRAYARLGTELWQPVGRLRDGLFEGTREPRARAR